MPTEIKDSLWSIEIDPTIPANNKDVRDMHDLLDRLHALVPISRIDVETGTTGGGEDYWDLNLTTANGRTWNYRNYFTNEVLEFTLATSGRWKPSEIVPRMTNLRDKIIHIILTYDVDTMEMVRL